MMAAVISQIYDVALGSEAIRIVSGKRAEEAG